MNNKLISLAHNARIHFQIMLMAIALTTGLDSLAGESPFQAVTQTRMGLPIVRTGYDLQPSILYDAAEPNASRRFKMWWLGQHPTATPADRIYYAESADGTTWSTPVPVLAPQLGASGTDAADDHLLGSPTVLKRNGKYYMYYEAYGNWATAVNRLYSFARGDNWTTHGTPQYLDDAGNLNSDWDASYDRPERVVHGFAPRLHKAGTHAVYAGEVRYASGSKYNRFLRLVSTPVRTDQNGDVWRQLNQGQPVFWLYDNPGAGRVPLYSFWDGANRNTFTSTNANADGVPGAWRDFVNGDSHILGYVATALDGPDMIGSLQNRIMLATSTDGINWTRFSGGARGGAVIAPQNERTSAQGFPPPPCAPAHERWDIHRAYGSGFPASTVRDGFLELYFTDDTLTFSSNPCGGLSQWRVRIPVADIENPQAYLSAVRQPNAPYGEDIKWSPLFRRYFAMTFAPGANQTPLLVWSTLEPDAAHPASFPAANSLTISMAAGRWGGPGGILSDGNGNTVDFFAPNVPESYSALHLFYEEMPTGEASVFSRNLGHTLVFGYPPLAPAAATPPTITTHPTSKSVDEGVSVSFNVAATGVGQLFYQWQKDGTAISGATTATLTFSSARPADAGAYRVVVSNAAGSTNSQEASLAVRESGTSGGLALRNFVLNPDGRCQFRIVGNSTAPCDVERSTDLVTWMVIDSVPAVNGTVDFVESVPSGSVRSFYRTVIRSNPGPTNPNPNPNAAPVVNAGPDLSVMLPASALLQGIVTDDGLPNSPGQLTLTWSKASGPGTVTFANSTAASTAATFSAPGTYRLWLTAFDGAKRGSNDVVVTTIANHPPTVTLAAAHTLTLPQPTTPGVQPPGYIEFRPVVTDDGLPNPARITAVWSQVSGPHAVGFDAPTGVNFTALTNRIYFPGAGDYVLRLEVSDGVLTATTTASVHVNPPVNAPPDVNAGPSRTIDLPDAAILAGSTADDGLPIPPGRLTNGWSKASGPGTVTFANLTQAQTTATFSLPGQYVLRLTAGDGEKIRTDTTVVTVRAASDYAALYKASASRCGSGGEEYRIRNTNPHRSIRYVVIITYSTPFAGEYETTFTGTVGAGSTKAIECIDPPGNPGGRTTIGARITSASF